MQMAMANEVVGRLEEANDRRPLGVQEDALRKELKLKALGSRRCSTQLPGKSPGCYGFERVTRRLNFFMHMRTHDGGGTSYIP
jgi:hypothetical protein